MTVSQLFESSYREAETRLSAQLVNLQPADLLKKTDSIPNSVGFLLRHIAEVELLFSKNVFNDSSVHVIAKTVIDKKDSGEWTNMEELLQFRKEAFLTIAEIIKNQQDNSWNETVHTKEFGTKTKAEAFGRIISHTAYHTGQLALILKYGKPN